MSIEIETIIVKGLQVQELEMSFKSHNKDFERANDKNAVVQDYISSPPNLFT